MAILIMLALCWHVSIFSQSPQAQLGRERLLMDFGWHFAFGNAGDAGKDFRNGTGYFSYFAKAGYGDGAASKNFDDRGWRVLDLPHDWAVEEPFDPSAGYSHGYKTVGRKFPATSVGWYRKTFVIPESDLGRRIAIQFDGVYRNSIVWLNGFYLGEEHSGYSGFRYDITDYLNYGGENVIAVRVDASMEEGWFYEGAGIYRHVWLETTSPLHVAPNGIFVFSEVGNKAAGVTARTTIANDGTNNVNFDIVQSVVNQHGETIARKELKRLAISAGETVEFASLMKVSNPNLWSIETPYLYKLLTVVNSQGVAVDRCETPFGIRTLRFDPQQGFFLNGKHVTLKGTNNHQDHAGVGTAIPDALQEFRIKRLKEMGSNAYRCSHNPPTPELLDVCDRLGMLVIDENRLVGTNEEHLNLLRRMILRDRNHPSVFIWSLGNEEWSVEGNITGARIASTMQAYVRRLDPTRRTTYANSGGWGHGISTVIDVMGFNYIGNGDIDKQHAEFPDQPAMGTEETTSRSTRGVYADDTLNAHMQATDRKPGGRSMEEGFKFYAARPFLSGLFFWTGFDYRGEPHPFGWPQVASQSGIVDLCGFPKDMFYYLKSWWTEEPVLHLLPHWNWKGREGRSISVWAYTNCDEAELFLNGKSLGRKATPKNSHLEWTVSYAPGSLLARGYTNGKMAATDQVETTGEPAGIRLVPDRSSIKADGEDVSVITVQVLDSSGRIDPTSNTEIAFNLQGPGTIIGVGNGDPSSHEADNFVERVNQPSIENLKAHLFKAAEGYTEVQPDFDDSLWSTLMNNQGEYNVRAHDTLTMAVIRGSFIVSDLTNDTKITLWPKSLGEEETVYVNGHLVAKGIKRDDSVQKYVLDRAIVHSGRNIYAVVGTPLVPRFLYDNLNTDAGTIQVLTPGAKWKRKAFNGIAQVLVQSARLPGEMILTATSNGLTTALLRIQAQAAPLRPAVKE